MGEGSQGLGFVAEAGEALWVVGHGGGQDLDGDLAVQALVPRAVDLAHPPLADLLNDPVVAQRLADHDDGAQCSALSALRALQNHQTNSGNAGFQPAIIKNAGKDAGVPS